MHEPLVSARPLLAPLVSARPLLAPLRELAAAYHEAVARVEALIEALTTGDFAAVQGAIAEQTATAARITRSGRQWEAARDELAVALRAHGLLAADAAPTVSDLLPVLAPDDALRTARRDVLAAVLRLQVLNRQAATLLRNARSVVQRVARAAAGDLDGYGPRGQYVVDGRWSMVDGRQSMVSSEPGRSIDHRPSTIDSSRRA